MVVLQKTMEHLGFRAGIFLPLIFRRLMRVIYLQWVLGLDHAH